MRSPLTTRARLYYHQVIPVDVQLGGDPVATQLIHNRYLLTSTYLSSCVLHTYHVLTIYIRFTTRTLLTTHGTLLTTMP